MAFSTKTCCLLPVLLLCLVCRAQRYTVLIHEIMADPLPVIGLPEAEYVEIKNTSRQVIDLFGWRLQTPSAVSGPFPHHLLQPDSLLIITSRAHTGLFGAGALGITAFPALANTGALIVLTDKQGQTIHAVQYDKSWYQNEVKAEGGWSLEMMDATNPCSGAGNWTAATNVAGGTPGLPNSVHAPNRDVTAPALLHAIAKDSAHLVLFFNEPMDSSTLVNPDNYRLEPHIKVTWVQVTEPLLQSAAIVLATPLQPGKIYTLQTPKLSDCQGNPVGEGVVTTGLPQRAQKEDLVINELLFNPGPDGTDYIELYNRSKKIIDISRLWMHTVGSASGNLLPVASAPRYLFPGGYLLLTEDENAVLRGYQVKERQSIAVVPKMPSLPDDKGSLAILNEAGETIDAVQYSGKWHFALIADADGVALERIDPEKPTQDKNNWTSAAAAAGFGTPTYRNSQYHQHPAHGASVAIHPKVFSPNWDGFDDFCTVSYALAAPNYVANLFVFDAGGRQVRHLVQNQTVTQTGYWRWDGTGEGNKAINPGIYVLVLELFNLEGKKLQFKLAVSLARR